MQPQFFLYHSSLFMFIFILFSVYLLCELLTLVVPGPNSCYQLQHAILYKTVVSVKLILVYMVQKYEQLGNFMKFTKYLKPREDGHCLGSFMKLYRVNVVQLPFENLLHASLMCTDIMSVTFFSFTRITKHGGITQTCIPFRNFLDTKFFQQTTKTPPSVYLYIASHVYGHILNVLDVSSLCFFSSDLFKVPPMPSKTSMQNLKIGVLLCTWTDLLKYLAYKHVRTHTHIHSTDPLFCHTAF